MNPYVYNITRGEVDHSGASVEDLYHYHGWTDQDQYQCFTTKQWSDYVEVTAGARNFDHMPVWDINKRCQLCGYKLAANIH